MKKLSAPAIDLLFDVISARTTPRFSNTKYVNLS